MFHLATLDVGSMVVVLLEFQVGLSGSSPRWEGDIQARTRGNGASHAVSEGEEFAVGMCQEYLRNGKGAGVATEE